MSARPNVFTIGSQMPFLPGLAQSWLSGKLDVGPVDDPLVRLDTTFYLPTRRAARAFADAVAAELGGTVLLPRIRTLADADDDEFLNDEVVDPDQIAVFGEALEPPNLATMPSLKRRLILTRLIGTAGQAMRKAMIETRSSDQPIFPQSIGESAHLANALADLIDQVATEESDWQALFDLVPDDHAAYWQLTLTLLTLVTQNWPAILADEGVVDPATRRRLLLDARTARIATGQHGGPVIAAGSTGSIPATARLLAVAARAPNGAVVLPGLDLTMQDQAFESLAEDTAESASHPQHGLHRLLQIMEVMRADVADLSGPAPERQHLVSAALLPATATGNWPRLRPSATRACHTITLLEAPGEGDESLAIAMAMKASLTNGETVALVTPDRNLARRVQLDLERFDLISDDSAGTPLRETPPARLMQLVGEVWRGGFAAIPLLALLKHPLTALGQAPATTRADARLLERLALRGIALAPGLEALRTVIALRADERDDATLRTPALRKALGPADDGRALALLDRLEGAFAPLAVLGGDAVPFAHYTEALFAVCEILTRDDDPTSPPSLYAGPAGDALAMLRTGLREAATVGLESTPAEAHDLFEALLADGVVRPAGPTDPRLHIWGPLEARLMAVDHMILGGLNEKAWPSLPSASPFLSRTMMVGMELAIPERRIGLSAHDVEQALGQPRVTLTRALKVDGAPTVASRWVQRLLAFLPEQTGDAMRARAAPLLMAARDWDAPSKVSPRAKPEPRPKVVPHTLSITEVETLIRDPYTVYAHRVLRLEEAPGLGLPPGPAERGTLFHALFENLAPRFDAEPPEAWPMAMRDEAQKLLATLDPFPDIKALWARRIDRVMQPYLDAERFWSEGLVRRVPEQAGRLSLTIAGDACLLTGRADRIDLYADGTACILDFKTGNPPSRDQVKHFAAQLPLSVAMVRQGAFGDLPPSPARAARYVQTGGNRDPFRLVSFDDPGELEELATNAVDQLRTLWASFLTGTPFTPLVRPARARDQGPFHHLARVKEWRTADEADGAGGGL